MGATDRPRKAGRGAAECRQGGLWEGRARRQDDLWGGRRLGIRAAVLCHGKIDGASAVSKNRGNTELWLDDIRRFDEKKRPSEQMCYTSKIQK